ncbi:MAG: flippase [Candidatus Bathyarchaeota archaeon]|nr:MAG: flippase [Candidatus Bathyarchaeota archaeon]
MSKIRSSGVRVARGATYMFAQGVIANIISVVYLLFLVRIPQTRLPPPPSPEMGIYFILTFIMGLVFMAGTLALPSASTKYIAQYLAEGKLEKARSVVSSVLRITSLASLILGASLFIFAESISTILFGTSEWSFHFRILTFASVFAIFSQQVSGFLQGLQKFRELAAVSLSQTVVANVVAIGLLFLGQGLFGVIYGWLAGFVVSALMGMVLTYRFLGTFEKPHPTRPLLKFSYPLYVSGILGFVAGWVDQLFILPYMGEGGLGVYGWAVRAATVPSLISSSIVIALLPQLSELYTKQGANSLREAFHVSTRYIVLIGFPMFVGLAALANPVMVVFAGMEYAEAALPLTIICLALLPTTLGLSINPTLLTLERTKTASVIILIAIFSNTIISYLTLAHLSIGIIGPAWARFLAAFVAFGLGAYVLKRILNVTFDVEALWKALVASFFMSTAVIFSRTLENFFSQLYLLPFYLVLGAAVYFFSLAALKAIKKHDVELIQEYLPKGLKRLAGWLGRLAFVK